MLYGQILLVPLMLLQEDGIARDEVDHLQYILTSLLNWQAGTHVIGYWKSPGGALEPPVVMGSELKDQRSDAVKWKKGPLACPWPLVSRIRFHSLLSGIMIRELLAQSSPLWHVSPWLSPSSSPPTPPCVLFPQLHISDFLLPFSVENKLYSVFLTLDQSYVA